MSRLVLIRHAPTAWNEAGKIQGSSDVPLSTAGAAQVSDWKLPDEWHQATWWTSPLCRATQTAALLGHSAAKIDPLLVEMRWGQWEGLTRADFDPVMAKELAKQENRGLDFQPPEGESPRLVQKRLGPWLQKIARLGGLHVAVAHKGVLRALGAQAYGWNMLGKAPFRLKGAAAMVLELDEAGKLLPKGKALDLRQDKRRPCS